MLIGWSVVVSASRYVAAQSPDPACREESKNIGSVGKSPGLQRDKKHGQFPSTLRILSETRLHEEKDTKIVKLVENKANFLLSDGFLNQSHCDNTMWWHILLMVYVERLLKLLYPRYVLYGLHVLIISIYGVIFAIEQVASAPITL